MSFPSRETRKKRYSRSLLLLLLIPCVLLLLPGIYNLNQPVLAGIPFFYWFQIFCIILTASILAFLYKVTE